MPAKRKLRIKLVRRLCWCKTGEHQHYQELPARTRANSFGEYVAECSACFHRRMAERVKENGRANGEA